MRNDEILGLSRSAVVEPPAPPAEVRRASPDPLRVRRELPQDFAEDEDTASFLRNSGRARRIRRGLIPVTRTGRIVAGIAGLALVGLLCFGAASLDRFLKTDARFRISSTAAIELEGNTHVNRAQVLAVFGEDIQRNTFRVPLGERQAELERIPWVEHATVMRLLPDRLRARVSERTPVAFTRQGGRIGMVDAHGVLLSMPSDAAGNPSYSFPVVTGIGPADDAESRSRRMRTFMSLLHELDSQGGRISGELSEVDLSDPEDVKALIPDGNSEVLVHFGGEEFLPRYKRFKERIGEWRTQYPRLTSVDMRYERQVVLQMPPHEEGSASPSAANNATGPADGTKAPRTQPGTPVHVASASAAHAVSSPPQALAISPGAPQSPQLLLSRAQPSTKPDSRVAVPRIARSSVPAGRTARKRSRTLDARSAETLKKVENIKAWMARREKSRQTTNTKTTKQL